MIIAFNLALLTIIGLIVGDVIADIWLKVSQFRKCEETIARLREEVRVCRQKYDEVMDTQHGQFQTIIDNLRNRNVALENEIDAWILKYDEMKAVYEKRNAEYRQAYLEEHDKVAALNATRNRDRA